MSTARAAVILLGKELRLEFRTRELLNATVVFAIVVVVLFSFAFDPTPAESRRYGPGLLWIAFLFSGSLMLHPSFAREQSNDTLDALRLAPVSNFAILLGKMLANLIFLSLAELVLVPVFAVLYNVSLAGIVGRLVLVLLLGTIGVVVTGTVFSALPAHARTSVAVVAAARARSTADRSRRIDIRALRAPAVPRPDLGCVPRRL